VTHIKKTIKQIRRPRKNACVLKEVYRLIGASVDDAKSSLAGNHGYSLKVLERALEIEETRNNRATMIQLLKRAIRKVGI